MSVNQQFSVPEQSGAVDALLGDYAAGSLPLPVFVMVAAHLEMAAVNRRFVAGLEHSLACEMDCSESDTAPLNRAARLESIFGETGKDIIQVRPAVADEILPASLATYIGIPFSEIRWKRSLMGIKEHTIEVRDGREVSLLWIKAGRKMPSHTHLGSEMTLVLKGSFTDRAGQYLPGSISVADSDVDHKPVIDAGSDCICFVVTDAPLRLTGPVGKFVSRFFGH